MDAIRAQGAMAGGWLGLKRICRCHPWGRCGHDPVPRRKAEVQKVEDGIILEHSHCSIFMDRTGIIVVTLCVILLGFWFVEQQKYTRARRSRSWRTNQPQLPRRRPPRAIQTPFRPRLTWFRLPVFDTNTPEELLVITNARARYTFTSRGGGLKSVELLDYPETVSPRWKKKVAKDGVATLNLRAPMPVLAILGDASLVGDGNFTLTQTPMASARKNP